MFERKKVRSQKEEGERCECKPTLFHGMYLVNKVLV